MMLTEKELEKRERLLLDGEHTPPGRVRTFLLHPEWGTCPHSCTLFVYKNDLAELLLFCSRSLRYGAGVKIILSHFLDQTPIEGIQVRLHLDRNHPDWGRLNEHLAKQMWNPLRDTGEWHRLDVADSMEESAEEGVYSIEGSWVRFIEMVKEGKKQIIIDLSRLRPFGVVNDKKLMASGPVGSGSAEEGSFWSIYPAIAKSLTTGRVTELVELLGHLNDALFRGGRKRGIVTSSMDYQNPSFIEYIKIPSVDLLGSHAKGAVIDAGILEQPELVKLIMDSCNYESLFLAKRKEPRAAITPLWEPGFIDKLKDKSEAGSIADALTSEFELRRRKGLMSSNPYAYQPHANVCMGLWVPDKGTCLIWRVNLGKITDISRIATVFVEATIALCSLHISWRSQVGDKAKLFAPLEEDRQVGLDVMGLANFLAIHGITYKQLIEEMKAFLDRGPFLNEKACQIVNALALAYRKSTHAADAFMRSHGLPLLEAIHTVEPAATHANETTDALGNVTVRAIFTPYGRKVRPISNTNKVRVAGNAGIVKHGNVEISTDYSPEFHQETCEVWQRFMTECGRPHAISFDTRKLIDEAWLEDFILRSPLLTKYYSDHEKYDQRFLEKQVLVVCESERPNECSVCAE